MKTEIRIDRPGPSVVRGSDPDLLASHGRKAAGRHQHAHYTHQLSEEATEAVSRLLIRIVPLVYGAILGSLADDVAIGLTAALAISLAFDLSMEGNSVVRGLYRRLRGQSTFQR